MSPGETHGPAQISRGWIILFAALALAGAGAFLVGVGSPQSLRAWQAYLVNYVFWTGLSFGAVLFVAVLNMTDARWGRSLKRLAEGLGAFLPASFLLFWFLYFGREEIFPWVHDLKPEKAGWLNTGFLFARNGAGLLLLAGASWWLAPPGERRWPAWTLAGCGAATLAAAASPADAGLAFAATGAVLVLVEGLENWVKARLKT